MRDDTRSPGWAAATFDETGPREIAVGGEADLSTGERVASTTRFRWFSVTKLVTAACVLRLVDEGRLALDEDVRERLAWFRPTAPMSARSLLSHSSGLASPNSLGWVHPPGQFLRSSAELTRATYARHRRLRSVPGAKARYTNLGYLVLGELIASELGSYESAARSLLADAGVASASFAAEDAARGHEPLRSLRTGVMALLFGRRTPGLVAYVRDGWVGLKPFAIEGQAYGGLLGSIEDLAALGRALLVPGLLSADSLRAMSAPQAVGSESSFGLGFWIEGNGWIGHAGEAGGYRAELRIHPEERHGVAVLANSGVADLEAVAARSG